MRRVRAARNLPLVTWNRPWTRWPTNPFAWRSMLIIRMLPPSGRGRTSMRHVPPAWAALASSTVAVITGSLHSYRSIDQMPRLSVHSRTRAQPSPRSSTSKDGDRSGHSCARLGPNSVNPSQTIFGSSSVSTEWVTLATELLPRDIRVDRHVGECIGTAILLSVDARHVHVGKLPQQPNRFLVKRDELGRFDAISAVHLLDHELGIQVDLETVWLPILHRPQALDEGVVLSLVVGGHTQPAVQATEAHAVLVLDHNTNARRTRIAARRAIREQTEELQDITRMRPQFSQWTIWSPLRNACIPEDVTVTWQA